MGDTKDSNYDDFMMSEDGEMEYTEIQNDSDEEMGIYEEEEGPVDEEEVSNNSRPGRKLSTSIKELYMLGKSLKEANRFSEGIEKFELVIRDGDVVWAFKAMKQVVKCWYFKGVYSTHMLFEEVEASFRRAVEYGFGQQHILGTSCVNKSLEGMLRKITPISNRPFVFDENFSIDVKMVKFHLNLLCIIQEFPLIDSRLESLVQQLRLENIVLKERLEQGKVTARIYDFFRGSNSSAEILLLHIECYISNFLERGSVPVSVFEELVRQVQNTIGKSFSVSQYPRTMSIIQFGLCILDMHYQCYPSLRLHFWECFQDLEEMGTKDCTFRELNLCGFILVDAILWKLCAKDGSDVDPFEHEQIKIFNDSAIVSQLQEVYYSFKNLDFPALASSLKCLERFKIPLEPLIDKLCQFARERILWDEIAPLYTCIAIDDIQQCLSIGNRHVTHDQLLVMLMQKQTPSSALIYFKIDFTNSCIYFGDEHRSPISSLSRKSLSNDTSALQSGNESGNRTSQCRKQSPSNSLNFRSIVPEKCANSANTMNEKIAKLREFTEDVGLFDDPYSPGIQANQGLSQFMKNLCKHRNGADLPNEIPVANPGYIQPPSESFADYRELLNFVKEIT